MPSRNTSGTTTSDRPTFEQTRQAIGENPARFLCSDLNVWPLIRGLRSFERATGDGTVAGYIAVGELVAADCVLDSCVGGEGVVGE